MLVMQPTPSPEKTAVDIFESRIRAHAGHGLAIAATAFLTLTDLFAVQSVLPTLARRFDVSAADIAVAANACTFGMALASLATAVWGGGVDRKLGIATSLALLSLPTVALAMAPDLGVFAVLRVMQGALMATAFTLMLAHLGEYFCPLSRPVAFAAFITGNVMSNLIGRIVSASVADLYGIPIAFFMFGALNLVGALLVGLTIRRLPPSPEREGSGWQAVRNHLRNSRLRAAFGIGFLILFSFIGIFSYVNFVLARPPYSLDAMAIGWVYLAFLPSLPTTLLMGRIVRRIGSRRAIAAMLAIALLGLPLLAIGIFSATLAGLVLVAAGTFAAQAGATGFVGTNAAQGRSAASGLYLAAYFLGGLAGSFVLGPIFDHVGWPACLIAIGLALTLAIRNTRSLE